VLFYNNSVFSYVKYYIFICNFFLLLNFEGIRVQTIFLLKSSKFLDIEYNMEMKNQ
jgi:hypothetical protein